MVAIAQRFVRPIAVAGNGLAGARDPWRHRRLALRGPAPQKEVVKFGECSALFSVMTMY
jgi:hypothetical protein